MICVGDRRGTSLIPHVSTGLEMVDKAVWARPKMLPRFEVDEEADSGVAG